MLLLVFPLGMPQQAIVSRRTRAQRLARNRSQVASKTLKTRLGPTQPEKGNPIYCTVLFFFYKAFCAPGILE